MEGDSIPVYMDYTDSRGKVHKIVKGWNFKQNSMYNEELAKGLKADGYVLHILHLPYMVRPNWQIQAEIDLIELPYQCEDRSEHLVREMEYQMAIEKLHKRSSIGFPFHIFIIPGFVILGLLVFLLSKLF